MAKRLYARVEWSVGDVQTLRPSWTDEQAEDWLYANQSYMQDAMIDAGWREMEWLLPPAAEADREDE